MLDSPTIKSHLGILSVSAREDSSLIQKAPKGPEETLPPRAALLASLLLSEFVYLLILNQQIQMPKNLPRAHTHA